MLATVSPYIFLFCWSMEEYSDLTKRKVRLYFAANYLFAQGNSYPQVIEILSEHETDVNLLGSIVDAAMVDKWRKIFNDVQRLIAEGKNYQEVIDIVTPLENDPEIVRFICNTWFDVQAVYAENAIEFKTNIWDGIQWIVICALGLAAMFYFDRSLIGKIVWGLGLLGAIITRIYGMHQRRLATRLKKILEEDYFIFDKVF